MSNYKMPTRNKVYTYDYSDIYKFVEALEQGINTCVELKKVGVTKTVSIIERAKKIGYEITYESEDKNKPSKFNPNKNTIKTFTLQSTPND